MCRRTEALPHPPATTQVMKLPILSLTLLAACGPVITHPGSDFSVTLDSSLDLPLTQRVAPVLLNYKVTGCDAFDLSMTTGQRVSTPTRKIVLEKDAPVAIQYFIDDSGWCTYDSLAPWQTWVQLEVVCKSDGRVKQSNQVHFSYAPAYRAQRNARGPVDAVIPIDATSFLAVGGGFTTFHDLEGEHGSEILTHDRTPPIGAVVDGSAFISVGCPESDCGTAWVIDTPTHKLGTSAYRIAVVSIGADHSLHRASSLTVAGVVADLGTAQGFGWALTHFAGYSVVWKLTPGAATIAQLVEQPLAGTNPHFVTIDGELVFMTRASSGVLSITNTKGVVVATITPPTPRPIGMFATTTDGMRWVLEQEGALWMYTMTGTAGALAVSAPVKIESSNNGRFGASLFLASGELVVSGGAGLELFASPGQSPAQPVVLYSKTESSPGVAALRAAGDGFAVLTGTGVQLFSKDGISRGGSDPLLPGCGLKADPARVATLSPNHLVLGGNEVVYVFRTDGSDGALPNPQ